MVGGHIIEIKSVTLTDQDNPDFKKDVTRLWVMNGFDECAVFVEPFSRDTGPRCGEQIWWQSGIVYYDNDLGQLKKVGYSFDPRPGMDTFGEII